MRIELSTVVLRMPEPSDIEHMYAYRNDSEVACGLGGFAPGFSRRDLQDWLEHHRTRKDEVLWVIADKETDHCLGHVGLYQIDHRLQKAELGICVGEKDRWGKGLGKEVCAAVLEFGFGELNLHQVRAYALCTNKRAVRLYERLGFKQDGHLRHEQFRNGQFVDSLVMSLLEDEWREIQPYR